MNLNINYFIKSTLALLIFCSGIQAEILHIYPVNLFNEHKKAIEDRPDVITINAIKGTTIGELRAMASQKLGIPEKNLYITLSYNKLWPIDPKNPGKYDEIIAKKGSVSTYYYKNMENIVPGGGYGDYELYYKTKDQLTYDIGNELVEARKKIKLLKEQLDFLVL